ncbi:MAG: tetratricopeptide repeat protein [Ignavibacteria bacterium]|nr:tetratricopeptide repeat protein [Ignavibacteria bacterium]
MSTEEINSPSTGGKGSTDWIERAQQQWKVLVVVALVATVAIAGYFWYSNEAVQNNNEAVHQLSRIRATYESGEYEKALNAQGVPQLDESPILGLAQISEQYSGTDAGKVAALMAGNCYLNLGKPSEAAAQFEIAKGSPSAIIEAGALQGLAACKESNKDFAGAAALYEQAAQRGIKTGLEEKCLLYAGFCYEKAGDKSKAGQLFTDIIKRYEQSDAAPLAKGGLARLGMAID